MQRGTHKLTLLARRTIPVGEELTISYVPLDMPRGERQKNLRFGYGFWCDCARCEREKDGGAKPAEKKEDKETEKKIAALASGVDELSVDGQL